MGDLNEDGVNDAVVTFGFLGPLCTAAGLETGGVWSGFDVPVQAPGSTYEGWPQLADVNDDGILDAIAYRVESSGLAGGLDVFLGDGVDGVGNGLLINPITTALPYLLKDLQVEDFNEDGVQDVVARSWKTSDTYGATDSVVVVRGVGAQGGGTGTFGPPRIYRMAGSVRGIECADLDQDGILDLAVSHSGTTTTILKGLGKGGKGNGLFEASGDYATGWRARIADLTEDGILDLISLFDWDSARVFPGNGSGGIGDGTFGEPIALYVRQYLEFATDLVVADANQDGRLDLLVSEPGLTGSSGGYALTHERVGGPDLQVDSFAMYSCAAHPSDFGRIYDLDQNGAPDAAYLTYLYGVTFFVNQCAPASAPTLTLLEPTGGEQWAIGTEHTIAWTRSFPWAEGVSLEVSRDGGANWERIAHDILRDTWMWTVTPPATDQARIRVRHNLTGRFADVSAGDFSIGTLTDVEAAPQPSISLSPPTPNPSRGTVRFTMALPTSTDVEVSVIDLSGRLVRTLARGTREAGSHDLAWDGTDSRGRRSPSGLYFLMARVGTEQVRRELVRLN